MSDTIEDLELFDDASSEFPGKDDFKDRLVLIFATGKHGERRGNDGKMYNWVETVTLVLDDGPNGDFFTELVPSAASSPIELNHQFALKGIVSRVTPRSVAKNHRPMLGRINSRKNKVKGFADSWSISEPTDEDKAEARKHSAKIQEIIARLENGGTDEDAFE